MSRRAAPRMPWPRGTRRSSNSRPGKSWGLLRLPLLSNGAFDPISRQKEGESSGHRFRGPASPTFFERDNARPGRRQSPSAPACVQDRRGARGGPCRRPDLERRWRPGVDLVARRQGRRRRRRAGPSQRVAGHDGARPRRAQRAGRCGVDRVIHHRTACTVALALKTRR